MICMTWQDGAVQLSNLIGIGIPAIKYRFKLFYLPRKLNVGYQAKQGICELHHFKRSRGKIATFRIHSIFNYDDMAKCPQPHDMQMPA